MILVALTLLLSATHNSDGDTAWEQILFDRKINECAVAALAAQSNNGGLDMNRESGHGEAVDRILEECRQRLGADGEQ